MGAFENFKIQNNIKRLKVKKQTDLHHESKRSPSNRIDDHQEFNKYSHQKIINVRIDPKNKQS